MTTHDLCALTVCLVMAGGCAVTEGVEPEAASPTTDTVAEVQPDTEIVADGAEAAGADTSLGEDASTGPETTATDAALQEDAEATTTVTFTTYINASCTELPPMNSAVLLDITEPCNEAPKASISDVVCYADKITYTNHPNVTGCDSEGFFNELPVGVCHEFPGPVATWKFIEPDTYRCLSAAD